MTRATDSHAGHWLAWLPRADLLPSWLVSTAAHLLLLICLALIYEAPNVLQGTSVLLGGGDVAGGSGLDLEDSAALGKHEEKEAQTDTSTITDEAGILAPSSEVLEETPLSNLSELAISPSLVGLETDLGRGQGTKGEGGSGDGVGGGIGDDVGPGVAGDGSGGIRTRLFDVEASGNRFVYVFDHSESMGYTFYYNSLEDGVPRMSVPMEAAKSQLLSSLKDLQSQQQFQIVFYNHQPLWFESGSAQGKLLKATPDKKRQAMEFVQRTYPVGGTNHGDALEVALKLKPNVIFLLTDGEEKDDLTTAELNRIRHLNTGRTQIHVIQFVQTPRPNSTLVRLAKDNRGKHVFVDITHVGKWAK